MDISKNALDAWQIHANFRVMAHIDRLLVRKGYLPLSTIVGSNMTVEDMIMVHRQTGMLFRASDYARFEIAPRSGEIKE